MSFAVHISNKRPTYSIISTSYKNSLIIDWCQVKKVGTLALILVLIIFSRNLEMRPKIKFNVEGHAKVIGTNHFKMLNMFWYAHP